jgi:hypothetical protein
LRAAFDTEFERAILQAARGDPAALCAYLRSRKGLTWEQREALADLLEQPSRKTRSRVGVYPREPTIAEWEYEIAWLARDTLDRLRKARGMQRAPWNIRNDVIEDIIAMIADDESIRLADNSRETIRELVSKRLKARHR